MKIEFLINATKTEEVDINNVYGFFQLTINEEVYGFCPKNPVEGLEGSELLSVWFEQLTEANHLINKTDYVLINDIDSHNSWIEIKKQNDTMLELSHIKSRYKQGRGIISLEPLPSFEYGQWKNVIIEHRLFSQEICISTNRFLKEITTINPAYSNAEWVKSISEKHLRICD